MSIVGNLLTRFQLRRLTRRGNDVDVQGRLWVRGQGSVEVGTSTHFEGGATGIELKALERDARILIGSRCRIGEGVSIEACELVSLSDDVTVGAWTKILDNHFHPLRNGYEADRPKSAPVVIEDDVVIGSRVIVLPGVRIQKGARIADDSVVSRRVGAGVTVGGNPARVLCRP